MAKPTLAALAAVLALAGCADTLLSDDRIRNSTALAINEQPGSVVISDRKYDGYQNTYYTASTSRATYRCRIDGGNASDFGMTNPPECSPVQSLAPPASPARRLRSDRQPLKPVTRAAL